MYARYLKTENWKEHFSLGALKNNLHSLFEHRTFFPEWSGMCVCVLCAHVRLHICIEETADNYNWWCVTVHNNEVECICDAPTEYNYCAFQLCQNVSNQHCVPPKPQFLTILIQVLGLSLVDAKIAIVSHIKSMQTFTHSKKYIWMVRRTRLCRLEGANLWKWNETNE